MLRATLYRSRAYKKLSTLVRTKRPDRGCRASGEVLVASTLSQPFRLVLAQEALEEAAVALLFAQDVNYNVLRDQVGPIYSLHDPVVEL